MYRLALALVLALTGPAAGQSCRTYGADSTCSDGTRARTHEGPFGSTTYVTRPDGSRATCRTYRTATGATTACR